LFAAPGQRRIGKPDLDFRLSRLSLEQLLKSPKLAGFDMVAVVRVGKLAAADLLGF